MLCIFQFFHKNLQSLTSNYNCKLISNQYLVYFNNKINEKN